MFAEEEVARLAEINRILEMRISEFKILLNKSSTKNCNFQQTIAHLECENMELKNRLKVGNYCIHKARTFNDSNFVHSNVRNCNILHDDKTGLTLSNLKDESKTYLQQLNGITETPTIRTNTKRVNSGRLVQAFDGKDQEPWKERNFFQQESENKFQEIQTSKRETQYLQEYIKGSSEMHTPNRKQSRQSKQSNSRFGSEEHYVFICVIKLS